MMFLLSGFICGIGSVLLTMMIWPDNLIKSLVSGLLLAIISSSIVTYLLLLAGF